MAAPFPRAEEPRRGTADRVGCGASGRGIEVWACLGRLEAAGLILPSGPAVLAARIKLADRRLKGWDLDLGRIRAGLAEDELTVLEPQFPGLAARLAAFTWPADAGAAY